MRVVLTRWICYVFVDNLPSAMFYHLKKVAKVTATEIWHAPICDTATVRCVNGRLSASSYNIVLLRIHIT